MCPDKMAQTQAFCSKFPWLYATSRNSKNDFMGNEGSALAAKKDLQSMNSLQNDPQNQPSDSLQMKGPDPAKFSICISRFLYDSDSILKSSILFCYNMARCR